MTPVSLARGNWRWLPSTPGAPGTLMVRCPLCNHLTGLDRPNVTADGLVQRLDCPEPACGFAQPVLLEAWAFA